MYTRLKNKHIDLCLLSAQKKKSRRNDTATQANGVMGPRHDRKARGLAPRPVPVPLLTAAEEGKDNRRRRVEGDFEVPRSGSGLATVFSLIRWPRRSTRADGEAG